MRKGIFAFTVFLLTFCSAVPLSAQRLLWDVGKYFGQNDPAVTLDYLLYYQYDGRYFKVNAGSFPRNRVTGHYPAAFYDDSYFFDTSIGGALLGYTRKWWRIEGVVDWIGCHDTDTRERFEVYSYGQAGAAWLGAADSGPQ